MAFRRLGAGGGDSLVRTISLAADGRGRGFGLGGEFGEADEVGAHAGKEAS